MCVYIYILCWKRGGEKKGCYLVKDLVASLPPSPFCAQPRSPRCVPGSVTPAGGEAWAQEWGKSRDSINSSPVAPPPPTPPAAGRRRQAGSGMSSACGQRQGKVALGDPSTVPKPLSLGCESLGWLSRLPSHPIHYAPTAMPCRHRHQFT